jgi:hypothetical protein
MDNLKDMPPSPVTEPETVISPVILLIRSEYAGQERGVPH